MALHLEQYAPVPLALAIVLAQTPPGSHLTPVPVLAVESELDPLQ